MNELLLYKHMLVVELWYFELEQYLTIIPKDHFSIRQLLQRMYRLL